MPTSTSPACTLLPSSNFDFSTAATQNPARSYSPGGYMSGISAVSPPISAQPDSVAARGDAADDRRGGLDVEFAGREIIQEEQGFGALHQHVVHAHRDQVDADGVVAAQLLRQLELGADAVGAGDQDRLAVLAGQVEQRAESAQAAHHLGPETALDQRLDAFDECVAGIDVDACVAIGQGEWAGSLEGVSRCGASAPARRHFTARCRGPRRGRAGPRCGTIPMLGIVPGKESPACGMQARSKRTSWRLLWPWLLLVCSGLGPCAARGGRPGVGHTAPTRPKPACAARPTPNARRHFGRALAQVLAKMSGDSERGSTAGRARRAAPMPRITSTATTTGRTRACRRPARRASRPSWSSVSTAMSGGRSASALGLPVWPVPRAQAGACGWRSTMAAGRAWWAWPRPMPHARCWIRPRRAATRLGMPGGNAAEQAAVGAIWRGDTGAIARLSARYSPPMQLIGKLYRGGGGWVADWTFVDNGKVLSTWTTSEPRRAQGDGGGADGAADALVKRYAKAGRGGPPGSVPRAHSRAMASADDYMRLMRAICMGCRWCGGRNRCAATGDTLELDLDLVTGIEGCRRSRVIETACCCTSMSRPAAGPATDVAPAAAIRHSQGSA